MMSENFLRVASMTAAIIGTSLGSTMLSSSSSEYGSVFSSYSKYGLLLGCSALWVLWNRQIIHFQTKNI